MCDSASSMWSIATPFPVAINKFCVVHRIDIAIAHIIYDHCIHSNICVAAKYSPPAGIPSFPSRRADID